jgi:hypothetical protein
VEPERPSHSGAAASIVLIGLLSIFAVACGDPGADLVEEETAFGEEEGGVVDDVDEDDVIDEHEEEIGDEDPEVEEPFCGDGFVDAE